MLAYFDPRLLKELGDMYEAKLTVYSRRLSQQNAQHHHSERPECRGRERGD